MWTCQKYAVDTHRCCLKRDRHGNSIKFIKIPDALQSPDYKKCRCRTSILRRMILRAGETLDLKEPRNAGIGLDFTTRIMTSWDWKRYAFVHFLRSNGCWGHPWQACNCVHVRLWVFAFVSRRWKSSRWTDGRVWAEQSETDWSTGLDVVDLGCRIEACHFVISEYFYSPQGWSSFIVCLFSPSRILSQMQWRLLAWIRPCWAFDCLVSTILCPKLCPKLLIISAIPLAASEVRRTGCFCHEFHIVSIGISHDCLSVEVIGIQSWARQTAVELAQARVVCKRAVLALMPTQLHWTCIVLHFMFENHVDFVQTLWTIGCWRKAWCQVAWEVSRVGAHDALAVSFPSFQLTL